MLAFLLSTQTGRMITAAAGGVALLGVGYFGFQVWLAAHDRSVANAAREGYVILAEKTAAEAKAAELQRQLSAATVAKQSLQEQINKDTAEDAQREKDREQRIFEYEVRLSQANRRCTLDRSDLDAILRN
jgi:predicted acyl esterase